MLNLQADILATVVNAAKNASATSPRWLNAINRAAVELETNPYIQRDGEHLLIASPSGNLYSANGVCQCTAYQHGQPCWHRAAGRIVQRYDERANKLEAARKATAAINELF